MIRKEDLTEEMTAEFRVAQIPLAGTLEELIEEVDHFYAGSYAKMAGYRVKDVLERLHGERNVPWTELNGLKILDLGSGSVRSFPWLPYFARICSVNGAEVAAIDRFGQSEQDRKLFKSIREDIVELVADGRLKEVLNGEKFDIVHSSNFVGYNTDPSIYDNYREVLKKRGLKMPFGIFEFEDRLVEASKQLVAEGGIIDLHNKDISAPKYFRKLNGELRVEGLPKLTLVERDLIAW